MGLIGDHRTAIRFGIAAIAGVVGAVLVIVAPSFASWLLLVLLVAAVSYVAGGAPGVLTLVLSWNAIWAAHLWTAASHGSPFDRSDLLWLLRSAMAFAVGFAANRWRRSLHKWNLRFGGIVEISEDAIITIDERQRITLFNPAAQKIFKYSADDALGQPIHMLLPERFRSMHSSHVHGFRNAGDTVRPMYTRNAIMGRRSDGSEFPAEASISKFEAGGEKIMTVRLRDITDRQAVEQRLNQMSAIVLSSQDAMYSEDLAGNILSWNPAAEEMFGYSSDEAVGQNSRILIDSGKVPDSLVNARDGKSSREELLIRRKDEKKIEVALTASPIRDANGNVIGVANIVRDITERKRLENQLQHSQKLEAVGRLAGGVAHDFNNLLGVIVGHSYLIESNAKESRAILDSTQQIMEATERARVLTRQLLAFSRKQVMNPEVLNLNDLASRIGKILPRLLGDDITVHYINREDLKLVRVDPAQMEQVILNLVVNARDAMPNGGTLTIETGNVTFTQRDSAGEVNTHYEVKPGEYVMLAVSDTGIGMDRETQTRIFEPFFTTKESGKGTGLGLATVYGIVNQSNGHIWVYSEIGHGTTFKIYLPVTSASATAKNDAQKSTTELTGRETVLLVEDQKMLRDLLSTVLREHGYNVIEASSGVEAVNTVKSYEGVIDVLLTDVVMPGMRGNQLVEVLHPVFPEMHVIYMSGFTDSALAMTGALPEHTTILEKPFAPTAMLQRIREALSSGARQSSRFQSGSE